MELVNIGALQLCLCGEMVTKDLCVIPSHSFNLIEALVSVEAQLFPHFSDLLRFFSQHELERFFFIRE